MSDHPHKFRYLLPPGSNFQFVNKSRLFMTLSIVMILGTVAILFVNKSVRGQYMNWTIDFKGGTEVTYAFRDKATKAPTRVEPHDVREALKAAGEDGFDVSEITDVGGGVRYV